MQKYILFYLVMLMPFSMQAGFKKKVTLVNNNPKLGETIFIEKVEGQKKLYWYHQVGASYEKHFQFKSKKSKIDLNAFQEGVKNGKIRFDGNFEQIINSVKVREGTIKKNLPVGTWNIRLGNGALVNTIYFDSISGDFATCNYYAPDGTKQRESTITMDIKRISKGRKHSVDLVNEILDKASDLDTKRNRINTVDGLQLERDCHYFAMDSLQLEINFSNGMPSTYKYRSEKGEEMIDDCSSDTLNIAVSRLQEVFVKLPDQFKNVAGFQMQFNKDGNLLKAQMTINGKLAGIRDDSFPQTTYQYAGVNIPFVLMGRVKDLMELDKSEILPYKRMWNYSNERGWQFLLFLDIDVYMGDYLLYADKMPEFPGGQESLMQFLAEKVKYPRVAQLEGIQGRVFVSFIITPEGEVKSTVVSNSIHPLLDQEAERVVKSMPDWIPAMDNGKNVAVKYMLPINFVLK